MRLNLRYVQRLGNGTYRYRRTVPKALKSILGQGEIVRPLGDTEREMLLNLSSAHADADKLLAAAKRRSRASVIADVVLGTPLDDHGRLVARLLAAGVDLSVAASVDDRAAETVPGELMQRQMLAEGILDSYPQDPRTGEAVGLTNDDAAMVRALSDGLPSAPVPTLSDALQLYLSEHIGPKGDAKARERAVRVIGYAKKALGGDRALTDIRRLDAQKIKTFLLAREGNTSATAKRNLASIKAVIRYSARMHELGMEDLFKGISVAVAVAPPEDRRFMSEDTLLGVRHRLLHNTNGGPDLRLIWTILEFTGCRLAEVGGIERDDVRIEGVAIPHIRVRYREGRSIKTAASVRDVPLVPAALVAVREALARGKGTHLFPRYASSPAGLSQTLMKHIRHVSSDPLEVVHSLRHRATERMALAGVPFDVRELVIGHKLPGVTGSYGSAQLRLMAEALANAFPGP